MKSFDSAPLCDSEMSMLVCHIIQSIHRFCFSNMGGCQGLRSKGSDGSTTQPTAPGSSRDSLSDDRLIFNETKAAQLIKQEPFLCDLKVVSFDLITFSSSI
jgi:hypothetical protein